MLQIIFIGLILAIVYCNIMLIKIEITGRHLDMLLNAVHAYNLNCIERGVPEETYNYFNVFPKFDTVLFRHFDWGYKNILSKDVMDKIRPFIKKK